MRARLRRAAFALFAAAWCGVAASACGWLPFGTTGVVAEVVFAPSLDLDQIEVDARTRAADVVVDELLPAEPRRLAAEGEAFEIVVDEALAGAPLILDVGGRREGTTVATARARVDLVAHEMVGLQIVLGSPDGDVPDAGPDDGDDGDDDDDDPDAGEGGGDDAGPEPPTDAGSEPPADAGSGSVDAGSDGECAAPGCELLLDGADATCDGEACAYRCDEGDCRVRGHGFGTKLDLTCAAETSCELKCDSVTGPLDACSLACETGAACELSCTNVTTCALVCAAGSDCHVKKCMGVTFGCGPFADQ